MVRIDTMSPVDMLKRDISHAFRTGLRESYSTYGTALDRIIDTVIDVERETVANNHEAYEFFRKFNIRIVLIIKKRQIAIHDRAGHTTYMFGGYSVKQICDDIEQLERDMKDDIEFIFDSFKTDVAKEICDSIQKIFDDYRSYRRAKFVIDHLVFQTSYEV